MAEIPKISEAEWEVMRVVWQSSPLTSMEIIERLESQQKWKPRTVKSLISRLLQKQALGYEPRDRGYAYFPLVGEQECIKAERRDFVKRVYGGALKPLLVSLLEEEKLTTEEIQELRQLLNNKEK